MRTEFFYVLEGVAMTLFSKRSDGDMVNLGKLIFADETGYRPDLLADFIFMNPGIKLAPPNL